MEYHSKEPVPTWGRDTALLCLSDSDHGFLTEWAALAITRAFGVPDFLQRQRVDAMEFKGLNQAWDDDRNPLPDGTIIFGADAADLAQWVCEQLKVSYLHQQGRGSRLRACHAALEQWHEENA